MKDRKKISLKLSHQFLVPSSSIDWWVDLSDAPSGCGEPRHLQLHCRSTQLWAKFRPRRLPKTSKMTENQHYFFPSHTARGILFICDTDASLRVCLAAEHNCGRHSSFKLWLHSAVLSRKHSWTTFSHNSWIMHKKNCRWAESSGLQLTWFFLVCRLT